MKKSILFAICLLFVVAATDAQYSVNKSKYNTKDYNYQVGDLYNPVVSGIASFIIPGLGQIYSGEAGRGAAFFGGYTGCLVVGGIGLYKTLMDFDLSYGDYDGGGGAIVAFIAGGLGATVLYIWSIFDAVKVAKINNLAWRDGQSAMNMRLQPYIGHMPNTQIKTFGLSFQVSLWHN